MTSSEFNYFTNHTLDRYTDEWVLVLNDRVVLHDKNLKNILKASDEKYPNNKDALLAKVTDERTLIL
ncbi:MAG: hypothetical protein MSIBF_01555 [Candidatus Altiarchaeales archaeon IMC4]|nr:MAG: hypothetical protein MSIBF_01555 [Candidatus Altiarchaeales archaeon IMC4]